MTTNKKPPLAEIGLHTPLPIDHPSKELFSCIHDIAKDKNITIIYPNTQLPIPRNPNETCRRVVLSDGMIIEGSLAGGLTITPSQQTVILKPRKPSGDNPKTFFLDKTFRKDKND